MQIFAAAAWIAMALWSMEAARSKGRSRPLWLLAGIFFGPLALLALAATGPAEPAPRRPRARTVEDPEEARIRELTLRQAERVRETVLPPDGPYPQ